MREQTVEYLRLYFECGWRMSQIAEKFGVNKSTVSRCIARAEKKEMPVFLPLRKLPA